MSKQDLIKINSIDNLSSIYFQPIPDATGNGISYISLQVGYNDNQEFINLDYRSEHFNTLVDRVLTIYKRTDDKENIVILGELTEDILKNYQTSPIKKEQSDYTQESRIYLGNEFNFSQFEPYISDYLIYILSEVHVGEKPLEIIKFQGQRNNYRATYKFGSEQFEISILFKQVSAHAYEVIFSQIGDHYKKFTSKIEIKPEGVITTFKNRDGFITGELTYLVGDHENKQTMKVGREVVSLNLTDNSINDEEQAITANYYDFFGINTPDKTIKTLPNCFISHQETVLNDKDFVEQTNTHLTITDDFVKCTKFEVTGFKQERLDLIHSLNQEIKDMILVPLDLEQDEADYYLLQTRYFDHRYATESYRTHLNKFNYKIITVPKGTKLIEGFSDYEITDVDEFLLNKDAAINYAQERIRS